MPIVSPAEIDKLEALIPGLRDAAHKARSAEGGVTFKTPWGENVSKTADASKQTELQNGLETVLGDFKALVASWTHK